MSDLISRQAAIDELCNMTGYRDDVGYSMIYRLDAVERIRAIPSAEPKKGKWEVYETATTEEEQPIAWTCYNCEEVVDVKYNFCPNCGADMRGEE